MKIIKIFIIFVISLAILFIAAELSFRVYFSRYFSQHPLYWKESNIKGVPYIQSNFSFDKIKINKHKPRIVVLGDYISIHQGEGPAQNNSSYPELLDNKLSHAYEIINTSSVFYSLPEEMAILKNKALDYNPDIIVFGYDFNDLYLKNGDNAMVPLKVKSDIYKFKIITPLAWEYLKIIDKSKNYSKAYERAPRIARYYASLYADNKLVGLLRESLGELSRVKKEKNIKVIFVVIPIFYNFEDQNLNYINDIICAECRQAGLDCLNLLEIFKQYKVMEVKEDDGDVWHPNRMGREIIASEIYKIINNENSGGR
jgi:hypothetical protein